MELKYRFLLKEINSALNMAGNREDLKLKMLEEIEEYSKTPAGRHFILELHKNLGKFVLFFMEHGVKHLPQGGEPF